MDNQKIPRAFKGIFIPREIWLNRELSYFEKVLLIEIDSLDHEETGCFASNKYFCEFFNESERVIQLGLAKLKKMKLIYQQSFDGRTRILRSCIKTTHEKFYTSPLKNFTPLTHREAHRAGEYRLENNNKDASQPKEEPLNDEDQKLIDDHLEYLKKIGKPKKFVNEKWKKTTLKSLKEAKPKEDRKKKDTEERIAQNKLKAEALFGEAQKFPARYQGNISIDAEGVLTMKTKLGDNDLYPSDKEWDKRSQNWRKQ